MNTRFFLNFLTAPKRNSGFAMPMVIMGGLVITVAAAAIAMKGMNDQNQVTSKAQSQQSEALAEAGASQYIDFLSKHPYLLTEADDSTWKDAYIAAGYGSISGYSGSISSSSSSSSAPSIPQSGATCQTTDFDSAGNPTSSGGGGSGISASAVPNWIPVSGNPSRTVGGGEVELVGYAYNSGSAVGALAVKGKVMQNGTAVAETQIQYAFAVRPEQPGAGTNTPIIPQIG
ncbi:hypothetical protein IQ225_11600, partial [Synechocystis salina LEGE 06155]|nr:hypothetical protein [Synechocystis salina LEGE 06155]